MNTIKSHRAHRTVKAAFLTAAIFSSLIFAAPQAHAHPKDMPRFAISGTGTITAEPDIAYVSTGVVSEGETASAALAENSRKMAAIFNTLEEAGIERKNIQTSNFSLQPRYIYHRPKNGEEQHPPRIVGYTVNNNVRVKVAEIAKTGEVITAVVEFGSNQLGNISFDLSNRQALLDEARKAAVLDARRKAEIYTQAAGVELGKILAISEAGGHRPQRRLKAASRSLALAESVAAPVSGGESKISITVNMTWELVQ